MEGNEDIVKRAPEGVAGGPPLVFTYNAVAGEAFKQKMTRI